MAVRKKDRFEIFKRDKFTCQYCGKSAPDVILHCDHIKPKSTGGTDDILNLVTSCQDCNLGKGPRELSDDAVLSKQHEQLAQLQERREQLEMMFEWQHELLALDQYEIDQLSSIWNELTDYSPNEYGKKSIIKWRRRFSVTEIIEAMKVSAKQYIKYDNDSERPHIPTAESAQVAWDKIPRICGATRKQEKKPYLKDLYYIRGILKNRISMHDSTMWKSIEMIEAAHLSGESIDDLKSFAKLVKNWTEFRAIMENVAAGETNLFEYFESRDDQ